MAVTLLGCGGGDGAAEDRVREVLTGLTAEGQRESALLMWNTGTLSTVGAADASDAFEMWCRSGGLDTVGQFQITSSEVDEGASPPAVIVSGTVDGRAFSVRVVKRQPITWVQTPR
jgi:hypothetical protein